MNVVTRSRKKGVNVIVEISRGMHEILMNEGREVEMVQGAQLCECLEVSSMFCLRAYDERM